MSFLRFAYVFTRCLVGLSVGLAVALPARAAAPQRPREKVIFDTDIGDDIDDAFALGLLLRSPEVEVLGVTSAWGDTALRARLLRRLLRVAGHPEIPVAMGRATTPAAEAPFTQAAWARQEPPLTPPPPEAVDWMLGQIRKAPDQITLISVAPFTNVGDLLLRDPATARKLKRIVIMGGSVQRGYGDVGFRKDHGPDAEYNILRDIPAAQQMFTAGIPLVVLTLDSTQLRLDEVKRAALFSADTPLTGAITTLYEQWTFATGNPTPTLFDVVAVAEVLDSSSCPTQPMRLVVDEAGFTREQAGAPNVAVCLQADEVRIFRLLLGRLIPEALP